MLFLLDCASFFSIHKIILNMEIRCNGPLPFKQRTCFVVFRYLQLPDVYTIYPGVYVLLYRIVQCIVILGTCAVSK